MADCLASRLAAQEEQIQLLTAEISGLREELHGGTDRAATTVLSPEADNLRAENEKLRYRLLHLRRGLQAELWMEEEAPEGKQPEAKSGKTTEKLTRVDNRVIINRLTEIVCIY